MPGVRVTGGFGDLERDLRESPKKVTRGVAKALGKNAREGNRLAKSIARDSAGTHGKHYPDAFSAEAIEPLVWEYGPDSAMPQGGMSFNEGSRNQPPHNDLEKSMDVQVPKLRRDISDVLADPL